MIVQAPLHNRKERRAIANGRAFSDSRAYYQLTSIHSVEREVLDASLMSGRQVLELMGWQPHAARNQALNDYAAKIRALITGRANIPDTVSGKPIVEVRLRLLVNGAVFDAQVVKPSGNRVYDEAVERAINGIQNWPLPQNAELLGGRRELILRIEHER